jgi:hypothetical protein
MAVHGFMSLGEHQYRTDIICSIPAGGSERMAVYGANFGRGTSRTFSRIDGKTLLITDGNATSVTQKTVTFKASDFNRVSSPTLAEIVAAINAVLSVDATPTVAQAGPNGELVILGGAASATGGLTIGAGTANVLLGFPKNGVTFSVINGTGVTVTFPAGIQAEYLYSHVPFVDVQTYTPATGVRAKDLLTTQVYTPSARTLLIANGGTTAGLVAGVARVAHIRIAF